MKMSDGGENGYMDEMDVRVIGRQINSGNNSSWMCFENMVSVAGV